MYLLSYIKIKKIDNLIQSRGSLDILTKKYNKINKNCVSWGKILKKYENTKSNVIGKLIKEYRKKKKLKKVEVCKQLQLHAVYIDTTELKRIEDGKMIVKDFELIAFCKVLDIDYEELKNTIE